MTLKLPPTTYVADAAASVVVVVVVLFAEFAENETGEDPKAAAKSG